MKLLGILIGVLLTSNVMAQFSVGGGMSTLFQFGNNRPFAGLHIVAESPRNNDVTFYGKMSYFFPQFEQGVPAYAIANDPATNPYILEVDRREAFNYFIIDGGTRYYLINGFDEGFSIYGGTNIAVVVNTVKYKYSDFDDVNYTLDPVANPAVPRGTILNLAAGLSGGLKYTFPARGSIYFDVNPSLMIFGIGSNPVAESTSKYKSVIFGFNIGYRKEFY